MSGEEGENHPLQPHALVWSVNSKFLTTFPSNKVVNFKWFSMRTRQKFCFFFESFFTIFTDILTEQLFPLKYADIFLEIGYVSGFLRILLAKKQN